MSEMFTPEQLAKLRAPLDLESGRIRTRRVGGADRPYIPQHEITDTLNETFGFGRWDTQMRDSPLVVHEGRVTRRGRDGTEYTNHVVVAMATVSLTVYSADGSQGCTHSDTGVWAAESSQHEPPPFDTAVMGAVSVAKRRCAYEMGNRFGNSLRDKEDMEGQAVSRAMNGGAKVAAPPPEPEPAPAPTPAPPPALAQRDDPPPPDDTDAPGAAAEAAPTPASTATDGERTATYDEVAAPIKAFARAHGGALPRACDNWDPPIADGLALKELSPSDLGVLLTLVEAELAEADHG